jgi:hypothetical protein
MALVQKKRLSQIKKMDGTFSAAENESSFAKEGCRLSAKKR